MWLLTSGLQPSLDSRRSLVLVSHLGKVPPLPGVRANGRTEAIVGVRPEALELAGEGLEACVEVVEELGSDAFIYCSAEQSGSATRLVARVAARQAPERGERVRLRPSAEHAPHVFDAETGERIGT